MHIFKGICFQDTFIHVCRAHNSQQQQHGSGAFFDAAMNLFRAATRHGSMVIIINDNVDEKRRIVSSISCAMERAVFYLSRHTYVRTSNATYIHAVPSIGRMSKPC